MCRGVKRDGIPLAEDAILLGSLQKYTGSMVISVDVLVPMFKLYVPN